MQQKRYVLLLSIVWLFMISALSCKNEQAEIVATDEEVDIIVPEGFEEFYQKFHQDSVFQREHIVFPLEKNMPESEAGEVWTVEDWVLHKPYDDYGGSFQRGFRYTKRIVFEQIDQVNGLFTMERRWANMSDGWNLIYYKVSKPKGSIIQSDSQG